jgi:hypothetical protein
VRVRPRTDVFVLVIDLDDVFFVWFDRIVYV